MTSRAQKIFDHFFSTTKKGFDETYWIFAIIAGAGIVTKLFGVGGLVASILAFASFYLFGRLTVRREIRIAKETEEEKKKQRAKTR